MLSRKMKMGSISVAVLGVVSLLSIGAATIVHAANRSLPDHPSYVALGDSIAAGAGLPVGSTSEDAACLRSPESYPNLLATKLHTNVLNLACGGAKDSDGILQPQSLNGLTVPAQLDRAFENGSPDVMTITIGANDIQWVQLISKCYVSTCGTKVDTVAVAGLLTYYQGKLAYTLHEIKERSGSHVPRVLITGYYYPVSSTSCLNGTVSASELRWINTETDNLNKSIRQTIAAASKISSWFKGSYNFASYVPINFNGHGICSDSPWVQGLSDPAPLHPNSSGATAIANTLSSATKQF